MAVFPDKIVLKSSIDDSATIIAAIQSGGASEIQQGELVIGREAGLAKLYTVDASGDIVEIAGGGGGGGGSVVIVSATAPTQQDNGDPLEDGNLWFNPSSGELYVYNSSTWNLSTLPLKELTDVAVSDADVWFGDLILLAEGTGTATSVYDTSSNHHSNLSEGTPPTYSTTTYKYGTSSFEFSGGTKMIVYSNSDLGFPFVNDFTVEGWLNFTDLTVDSAIFFSGNRGGVSQTAAMTVLANGAGIKFYYSANGGTISSITFTGTTLSTGTWYHIAACRSGNDLRVFVNGTQYGTTGSITGPLYTNAYNTYIGCYIANAGNAIFPLIGYLDDFRYTNSALYTANFTAGPLTPISVGSVNGDVLTWVAADSKWKAITPAASTIVSATAPTTRLSGAALAEGDLWMDSDDSSYYVYYGSTWVQISGGGGGGATSLNGLTDVDTATTPPTDGQVLTWVDANSQWEAAQLDGTSVRAALGIGEYVDDAAAGTGGVASGAMYYNTTSSDYRLKT